MPEANASEHPDTVSREAHQRMTDERNEWKAKAETLQGTVLDMSVVDKARRHFSSQKVDDPDYFAELAVPKLRASHPEIFSQAEELAKLGEYLDADFGRFYPDDTPPANTPPPVPEPDAMQPPDFTRPSPAADGAAPSEQKMTINHPEVRALIEANDEAGLRQLDKEGRIAWRTNAPGPFPG